MAFPITIPNTFATAVNPLPLTYLDQNFSVLVNAVNSLANGSGNFSNINVAGGNITVTTANIANLNVSNLANLAGGARIPYVVEPVQITPSGAANTVNFYVKTHSIVNYSNAATANWTVNLTYSNTTTLNTVLAFGEGLTCAFLAKQGGTAYYNNVVQVDGTTTNVTTYWQGGTAPTSGNTNGVDVYTYTIIKTATSTFDVYASQTQFA